MALVRIDRFVRLPSEFLDCLFRLPLNGTQLRIVLWVVRQTWGWNRRAALFRWYRVAKELGLDRAGVYRNGKRLCYDKLLLISNGRIALQEEMRHWRRLCRVGETLRPALPIVNADARRRERGRTSSLYRRRKDSSKDRINILPARRRHPAGAARPVPGKYDGLFGA